MYSQQWSGIIERGKTKEEKTLHTLRCSGDIRVAHARA